MSLSLPPPIPASRRNHNPQGDKQDPEGEEQKADQAAASSGWTNANVTHQLTLLIHR